MNGFTVEWEPDAEDELARLWLASSDPNAITAAQARIDSLLSRDPLNKGQHVSEGLYRLDDAPLTVTYTIDQARHSIQVTWVWSRP